MSLNTISSQRLFKIDWNFIAWIERNRRMGLGVIDSELSLNLNTPGPELKFPAQTIFSKLVISENVFFYIKFYPTKTSFTILTIKDPQNVVRLRIRGYQKRDLFKQLRLSVLYDPIGKGRFDNYTIETDITIPFQSSMLTIGILLENEKITFYTSCDDVYKPFGYHQSRNSAPTNIRFFDSGSTLFLLSNGEKLLKYNDAFEGKISEFILSKRSNIGDIMCERNEIIEGSGSRAKRWNLKIENYVVAYTTTPTTDISTTERPITSSSIQTTVTTDPTTSRMSLNTTSTKNFTTIKKVKSEATIITKKNTILPKKVPFTKKVSFLTSIAPDIKTTRSRTTTKTTIQTKRSVSLNTTNTKPKASPVSVTKSTTNTKEFTSTVQDHKTELNTSLVTTIALPIYNTNSVLRDSYKTTSTSAVMPKTTTSKVFSNKTPKTKPSNIITLEPIVKTTHSTVTPEITTITKVRHFNVSTKITKLKMETSSATPNTARDRVKTKVSRITIGKTNTLGAQSSTSEAVKVLSDKKTTQMTTTRISTQKSRKVHIKPVSTAKETYATIITSPTTTLGTLSFTVSRTTNPVNTTISILNTTEHKNVSTKPPITVKSIHNVIGPETSIGSRPQLTGSTITTSQNTNSITPNMILLKSTESTSISQNKFIEQIKKPVTSIKSSSKQYDTATTIKTVAKSATKPHMVMTYMHNTSRTSYIPNITSAKTKTTTLLPKMITLRKIKQKSTIPIYTITSNKTIPKSRTFWPITKSVTELTLPTVMINQTNSKSTSNTKMSTVNLNKMPLYEKKFSNYTSKSCNSVIPHSRKKIKNTTVQTEQGNSYPYNLTYFRNLIMKKGHDGKRGEMGERGNKGNMGSSGKNGNCGSENCASLTLSKDMKGNRGDLGYCSTLPCQNKKGENGYQGSRGDKGNDIKVTDLLTVLVPEVKTTIDNLVKEKITYLKGEPGTCFCPYRPNGNQFITQTIILKDSKELQSLSPNMPVGQMTLLITENILLLKIDGVKNHWKVVKMDIPRRDWFFGSTQLPKIPKVGAFNTKLKLMLIALPKPIPGSLKADSHDPGAYSGSTFLCQKEAYNYGLGRAFYPLLSTDIFDFSHLLPEKYHYGVPVVNRRNEKISNSFADLINSSSEMVASILDFKGNSILSEENHPCVWIGEKPVLQGDKRSNDQKSCLNWISERQNNNATVTILQKNAPLFFSGEIKSKSCNTLCYVLCLSNMPINTEVLKQ